MYHEKKNEVANLESEVHFSYIQAHFIQENCSKLSNLRMFSNAIASFHAWWTPSMKKSIGTVRKKKVQREKPPPEKPYILWYEDETNPSVNNNAPPGYTTPIFNPLVNYNLIEMGGDDVENGYNPAYNHSNMNIYTAL